MFQAATAMPSKMAPTATNWERSVCFVRGYHKHSYPTPMAYDLHLRHRFAIVMRSDPEGSSDAFFDAEFFLQLSQAMQTCIDFDEATIVQEGLGDVHSFHELSGLFVGADELEREAPLEIYFRKGPQLICMEQTEFGGPDIYADSYTFSYYSISDHADMFAARCKEMCCQDGVEFSEVLTAEPVKQPFIPWYKRPLPLIGMKAW